MDWSNNPIVLACGTKGCDFVIRSPTYLAFCSPPIFRTADERTIMANACCANPCPSPNKSGNPTEDAETGLGQKHLDLWKLYLRRESLQIRSFINELIWFVPVMVLLMYLL